MKFARLSALPAGSVRAEGFLRDQLMLNKDGMGGHLDEIAPAMIADPFVNRKHVGSWGEGDQAGWGAEIAGNYWTGVIDLAFSLNDAELIEKATAWVDAMLAVQRDDGYLGNYTLKTDDIYDDYNAWGTACAMRGLISFYEATRRKDVIEAVHRCMLWFCEKWDGENKTNYAGEYITEPMLFCYEYTGDERLLRFAEEYTEYLCKHDVFRYSYRSFLDYPLQYNSNHTAGLGAQSRLPALLYAATGKSDYLKATAKILDEVYDKATHITGSPVSVTEYLGPVSSVAETEYCSYAFYHTTYFYMSYITGEAKYGDRIEEMFYNGAQGARKKDERAIAYLNSPNQLYATVESSSAVGDMQVYAPCYPVSCCPVNSVAVLGNFVRSMFLSDKSGSLYANVYGPCSVRHNGAEIEEITNYPFRDEVKFVVKSGSKVDLCLRTPSWSKKYSVKVNGNRVKTIPNANGFVKIDRGLNAGDEVLLRFDAEVEIIRVNDDCKKHPIAIKRGALVFALPIEEMWLPIPERAVKTKGKDGKEIVWNWYNVHPVFEEAPVRDPHEMLGLRRDRIYWNVALSEKLTGKDVKVEFVQPKGYAWKNPSIKLRLKGWKAPYLCSPYPRRTFEPFGEKQSVEKELDVTLVPYGCTNLRITYFPIADLPEGTV